MASVFSVGVQPTQVLWSIQPACTLVNTGAAPVYVDDNSAVAVSQALAIPPGGSLWLDSDVELWACTATGSGQLQLVFDSDSLALPAVPGATLVYSGTATSGSVSPQAFAATQYRSVAVTVQWPQGGTLTAPFAVHVQAYQTAGAFVTTSGSPIYAGQDMEVVLPVYFTALSSPTLPAYNGAVFPVHGNGFAWAIYDTLPAGSVVNVYGLPDSVPGPMPWTINGNTAVGSPGYTVRTDVNSSWYPYGSTYTLGALTQAAATTATYTFPAVAGPVRVITQYTQTGAGASSVRVLAGIRRSSGGGPITDTLPFDVNLASSTAAGTVYGAATYAVWPTSLMQVQVTTAAGVTLSSLYVTIVGGQA